MDEVNQKLYVLSDVHLLDEVNEQYNSLIQDMFVEMEVDEANMILGDIYHQVLDSDVEYMYQEMIESKFYHNFMMVLAANSYDGDAIAYYET